MDRAGFEPAAFRNLDHQLVCKPDILRPDQTRQHTRLNYRPTRPNPIFYPVKAFDEARPLRGLDIGINTNQEKSGDVVLQGSFVECDLDR